MTLQIAIGAARGRQGRNAPGRSVLLRGEDVEFGNGGVFAVPWRTNKNISKPV